VRFGTLRPFDILRFLRSGCHIRRPPSIGLLLRALFHRPYINACGHPVSGLHRPRRGNERPIASTRWIARAASSLPGMILVDPSGEQVWCRQQDITGCPVLFAFGHGQCLAFFDQSMTKIRSGRPAHFTDTKRCFQFELVTASMPRRSFLVRDPQATLGLFVDGLQALDGFGNSPLPVVSVPPNHVVQCSIVAISLRRRRSAERLTLGTNHERNAAALA